MLVQTVRSTFPAHEHDHFVAHYRGLLAAWARDDDAGVGSPGRCGAVPRGGPAMATTEIAARKLGKITPRVDVRTLTLSRYVDRAQLPDPPRDDRPHRARRGVADVRERPNRRLHDRCGGAHDRGVDGGGARLRGRGDRVGGPHGVRPRQDRRSADRGGGRGRARRAARLAQARRRPPPHRSVRARLDERPPARAGGGVDLRRALHRPPAAVVRASTRRRGTGTARWRATTSPVRGAATRSTSSATARRASRSSPGAASRR